MKRIAPLLIILLCRNILLFSQTNPPQPPTLYAPSAILLDYATGDVLYEKQADRSIPPASLTKLVTLHVIYSLIDWGLLEEDSVVTIPEEAWARNMPEGSSLMFLGPGQNVTVKELMKGLAISSGNDAAVALAVIAAGSITDFATLMNDEIRALGFENMYFEEPSGLSKRNRITARDFAGFCRKYIELRPQSLKELHIVKTFAYPEEENLQEGVFSRTFIQKNRNSLLWELDYVDGLKTGYIEESGYNFALTGRKNGMRLVAVILGVEGENHIDGAKKRSQDGKALLSYGFNNFETLRPSKLALPEVRIWKGKKESFPIRPAAPVVITILKSDKETLTIELDILPDIEAPVETGDIIGELVVYIRGKEYNRFPLAATEPVERGGFFRVVYDSVVLFFKRL